MKDFGLEENVWELGSWNGEGITKIWSKFCHRLDPYLRTEGNSNKIGCMEKSQKGGRSWRTCCNNMQKNCLKVIEFVKNANFQSFLKIITLFFLMFS